MVVKRKKKNHFLSSMKTWSLQYRWSFLAYHFYKSLQSSSLKLNAWLCKLGILQRNMSGHDSKYFSTTKKGEIPELKEELNSQYKAFLFLFLFVIVFLVHPLGPSNLHICCFWYGLLILVSQFLELFHHVIFSNNPFCAPLLLNWKRMGHHIWLLGKPWY